MGKCKDSSKYGLPGRVIDIVYSQIYSPVFGGTSFGTTGQYERWVGVANMEINPKHPDNQIIPFIHDAPKGPNGWVQYQVDVDLIKPINLANGNNVLLYEAPNRGGKLLLEVFNGATTNLNNPITAADAGNGYLFNLGYSVLWTGWESDLPAPIPALLDLARLPIIPGFTGKAIQPFVSLGLNNAFSYTAIPATPTFTATLTWPTVSTDPKIAEAVLTVKEGPNDQPQIPSDMSFQFVDQNHVHIVRTQHPGFDYGAKYYLSYIATDAKPLLIGVASIRDVVSHLLATAFSGITNTIFFGQSQDSELIENFMRAGFNNLQGEKVFQGAINVSGVANDFIYPKAFFPFPDYRQANYLAENPDWPGFCFPFAWNLLTNKYDDPLGACCDGYLKGCSGSKTCPKIIEILNSDQYRQRAASLNTTNLDSTEDLKLPSNIRILQVAGSDHLSGSAAIGSILPTLLHGVYPYDQLNWGSVERAALSNMTLWLVSGIAPPPSLYPRLDNQTLSLPDQVHTGFPDIPVDPRNLALGRVVYTGQVNIPHVVDFSVLPPIKLHPYIPRVPKVNADGNEIAGLLLPQIQVPLGTYVGWNYYGPGYGEGQLMDQFGAFFPFAATEAQRLAANDPRPSLEARYGCIDNYVAQFTAALDLLIAHRYILSYDRAGLIAGATATATTLGLPAC